MQVLAIPAQEHVAVVSDDSLVARALEGDGQAFRIIFDRHAPAVRRFLRDLLKDPVAADEATQETFVRAHSRLAFIKEPGRLGSWLFGIGRRVAMERMRGRKRDRAHDSLSPDDDERPGVQLSDDGPTPEMALLTREADRMLADALAMLTDERRQALLMRIDHGLGYGEIAEAMQWSLPKVKNEIHRARLQLRSHLKSYMGGEA